MKKLDLSYGNPTFMDPYWKDVDLTIPVNLPSKYILGSMPELQDCIRNIHQQEENANTKDKTIVVGAGATQLLSAILRVYNKPAIANPPYFMRFPDIAYAAKVHWKDCPKAVEIITSPNNPDGKIPLNDTLSSQTDQLFDLSYNWNQYTLPIEYNQDVMIFSLSKATGHASTRIGWALFKDASVAQQVTNHIEYSTCGVSIEAQTKAIKILKHQLSTNNTCFKYGRKILTKRHRELNNMKLPFTKISNNGMFLWLQMVNPEEYFTKLNIDVVYGTAFGMPPFYARVNIGCSEKNFRELKKRLLLKLK